MDQPKLFVEDIYDAQREIVRALGGPKKVAPLFWPAKSVADAARLLNDCLNTERSEKLDAEQFVMLFRLAREANFHVAKHWLDTETGYVPSAPADPRDEQAKLVETIESAGRQLQGALTALDKLRERKPLTRVA